MAKIATIGSPSGQVYVDSTGKQVDQATATEMVSEGTGVHKKDVTKLKDGYSTKPAYKQYTYDEGTKKWIDTGEKVLKSTTNHYDTEEQAAGKTVEGGSTDWGAADISKDDFVKEDGTPREIQDIYGRLDPKLPNITGDKLKLQIRDMLPKYTGATAEEKGFAKEDFEKDVYGISKAAGKAGAQMRQAYGSGMGTSMRGAYGTQQDVSQQFKQAEQGYAKDIYGLEKQAGQEFESGVSDWMQESWFETPEGGTPLVTGYKQGGRVPSKKSFLEVLTAIPDAGGS